ATRTDTAARRFYNAPDVAAVNRRGTPPFFNIAIGSGYRGHPLNTTIKDYFYSIRDYQPFTALTQDQYDGKAVSGNVTVIHNSDAGLVDVTNTVKPDMGTKPAGWRLQLNQGAGEKSLASSTTLNYVVLFPTYQPNVAAASSTSCTPAAGKNRAYAVSLFDA